MNWDQTDIFDSLLFDFWFGLWRQNWTEIFLLIVQRQRPKSEITFSTQCKQSATHVIHVHCTNYQQTVKVEYLSSLLNSKQKLQGRVQYRSIHRTLSITIVLNRENKCRYRHNKFSTICLYSCIKKEICE